MPGDSARAVILGKDGMGLRRRFVAQEVGEGGVAEAVGKLRGKALGLDLQLVSWQIDHNFVIGEAIREDACLILAGERKSPWGCGCKQCSRVVMPARQGRAA